MKHTGLFLSCVIFAIYIFEPFHPVLNSPKHSFFCSKSLKCEISLLSTMGTKKPKMKQGFIFSFTQYINVYISFLAIRLRLSPPYPPLIVKGDNFG